MILLRHTVLIYDMKQGLFMQKNGLDSGTVVFLCSRAVVFAA